MDHIRGEKVVFGKGDYCSLERLPSALKPDANILATPKRKNRFGSVAKFFVAFFVVTSAAVLALFVALERGYLDDMLTARAEAAMSRVLGDEFDPDVKSVRLRISGNWLLALAAGDVKVTDKKTGIEVLKTDQITAVIDPLALFHGRVALLRAEIGTAEGDLRFLPPSKPIDWKTIRIDSVPALLEAFYPKIDGFLDVLDRSDTQRVLAKRLSLKLPQKTKLGDTIALENLDFTHPDDRQYVVTSDLLYGKLAPRIDLALNTDGKRATSINLDVSGLASEPLLFKYSKITGEKRYGLDLPLEINLVADRDQALKIRIRAGKGIFYADGIPQNIESGTGLLSYNFADRKVELTEGLIDAGQTKLPIEGAFIDLDRREAGKPHGFAFNAVGNSAIAKAEDAIEPPERFNIRADGYFLPETKQLIVSEMGVDTSAGALAGSLAVTFAEPSPAVTFAARADQLSVSSVKQLWPFWIARKVRHWALTHMDDGLIRNGEIDVALAAGRIPEHPIPLVFGENEIRISLDAENTNLNFIETMPHASKLNGHLLMKDRHVTVDVKSGNLALPSGATVTAKGGTFDIPDISVKPLMANLDLAASAEASALVELSGFKPIEATKRLPFVAKDISGSVEAQIKAHFGLDKEHNPPKPDYMVALDLKNIAFKKEIQDREISDLDGALNIDRAAATLKGRAKIDGMEFNIAATEPITKQSGVKRVWALDGTVTSNQIAKAVPQLAAYIDGDVGVSLKGTHDSEQKAELDLAATSVSLPVIGWKKGVGVPAKAEFTLKTSGGVSELDDFSLGGEDFGARGSLRFDKKGIVSAKFSRVKLSTFDDYALNITRKSGGLAINVSGNSIDLRPLLDQAKSGAATGSGDGTSGDGQSHTIIAKLDRAGGYNKEALGNLDVKITTRKGTFSTLSMQAVTKSGEAVVMRKDNDAGAIEMTSGDAGAIARFADLYRNMNGGLLNVSLKAKDGDSWRGHVDIRNFSLVNEQRLKSIVSSRSGSGAQSLSDAVDADIDVSSQKFRRAFVRVLVDGKKVRVENGIVRGDQVGATFQGTVRDGNGRMDMTGTFMPAYGLNSLVGRLPIVGALLGNGRDRGLLGITFKLEGPYDQPKLSVNPLSIIAPGVFRNIFEFQ